MTLEKRNGALGLGFNRLKTFHGAAVVNELFEGGVAAQDGRLRVGDALAPGNVKQVVVLNGAQGAAPCRAATRPRSTAWRQASRHRSSAADSSPRQSASA